MVNMWAYGIEKERLIETRSITLKDRQPSSGIRLLSVPRPTVGPDDVLVEMCASALNYNSIWSSLAHPVDPFSLISGFVKRNPSYSYHLQDYAIFGSDGSGIVAEVGENVSDVSVGDAVVIHCNVVDPQDPLAQNDAMMSTSQGIWGYETNFGAFAEYSCVNKAQVFPKPINLTFEESAGLMLTLSTAYRMLISENGAQIKAGEVVLVWGASGGLGAFGVQLAKLAGATVIGIASGAEKCKIVEELGADFTLDRNMPEFQNLIDANGRPNLMNWAKLKRYFKREGIPEIDVVFEHVGRSTLGFSIFILKRGGRVVTCAATSGYEATIDLRYLWMELKTLIGSHFANNYEAASALQLVTQGKIKPVIDSVNPISELPAKIDEMYNGNVTGKVVFTHGYDNG